jgi:2-dehydro-3-deoxyphosphogluconate aldolase/(4S)-4-hydroxy-2-oxoglutarate aldolase
MKDIGLIPVFYNSDFEVAKKVICACEDGEARIIEFTNRGDRATSVFTSSKSSVKKKDPALCWV